MTELLVFGQIDDLANLEAVLIDQCVDYILAAFRATIRRFHRIENDRAIRMKTHPVVGENGIRRMRLLSVCHFHDHDPARGEGFRQAVEFGLGVNLLLFRRR